MLSEEKILTSQGISFESLSCVADAYLLIETALQIQTGWSIQPEFCLAPETMLKSFVTQDFPARTLDVLMQRWGIGYNAPKTLEEIGQKMSLTRERVRQIEAKGLRLKNSLNHHSPCYRFIAPLVKKNLANQEESLPLMKRQLA